MSDLFCIIEEDEKTFILLNKYLNECHNATEAMMRDNMIQYTEIQNHILINCVPEEHHNHEALNWVEDNGEKFRVYLNTIKILWAAHILVKGTDAALTYDDFRGLKRNFTHVKSVLGTIRP